MMDRLAVTKVGQRGDVSFGFALIVYGTAGVGCFSRFGYI